jgi:hypothetical protein
VKITVETVVKADLNAVRCAWNNPEDIKQWNAVDPIRSTKRTLARRRSPPRPWSPATGAPRLLHSRSSTRPRADQCIFFVAYRPPVKRHARYDASCCEIFGVNSCRPPERAPETHVNRTAAGVVERNKPIRRDVVFTVSSEKEFPIGSRNFASPFDLKCEADFFSASCRCRSVPFDEVMKGSRR